MTSAESPPVIEVFADISCPYTHVGLKSVASELSARGRGEVGIRVRAWPLEWINGRGMDIRATADHIDEIRDQVAPELFIGFDPSHFPHSTIRVLAFVASAYRDDPEAGQAVSFEVRDRLFERGEDVSQPKILAAIADTHGLSLPGPDDYAAVVADWKEGRERGVAGSPHFFCAGQNVFCPSLRISKDEGSEHRTIDANLNRLRDFLDGCLGQSPRGG